MGLRSYITASIYNLIMQSAERKSLARLRSELLSECRGQVLELGAGTGINLPHYGENIQSLTLTEPDVNMRRQLKRQLDAGEVSAIDLRSCPAEHLEVPDCTFDTVVATLVLCSVHDVSSALAEVYRVLKPGGRFLFLEHVGGPKDSRLRQCQEMVSPYWKYCSCGCHLARDTEDAIRNSSLDILEIQSAHMHGAPRIVSPLIVGSAKK